MQRKNSNQSNNSHKLHNRFRKKFHYKFEKGTQKKSRINSKESDRETFHNLRKGSRMYNEESDEDEQLLKKEHKGMIYIRALKIRKCSIAPTRHLISGR